VACVLQTSSDSWRDRLAAAAQVLALKQIAARISGSRMFVAASRVQAAAISQEGGIAGM
jgi:hypothetical protein